MKGSIRPPERSRALLLGLFALGAGAASLGIWSWRSEPPERPNIVLIVADTLRQDYLGSYGFRGDVSPAIDRFASESVVFENAVSAAPWTAPAVASIFTSTYVQTHGLHGFLAKKVTDEKTGKPAKVYTLNERLPTLASLLQESGYTTTAVWTNPWLSPAFGLKRGFESYLKVSASARVSLGDPAAKVSATPVVRLAVDHLEKSSPEQPFFLYLHFMDAHGPYDCSEESYRALESSPSLPADRSLTKNEWKHLYYLRNITESWPSEELRESLRFWATCYAAGVREMDANLDRLFRALDHPRLHNTVVVFTSDHGEALLDHSPAPMSMREWEHGWSLHFHQTRVPLMFRLPRRALAGTRVSAPVSSLDVMPTLLTLAGVETGAAMYGRDLAPVLRGEAADASRRVISGAVKFNPQLVAVQDEAHKLIWKAPASQVALFDLASDPKELTNIAAEKPEVVAQLRDVAAQLLERMEQDPPPVRSRADIQETQIVDELRALGYVE